jgi:hypothetical protein
VALIRGVKGLCPCPICLVPADKLLEHAPEGYEHRTATQTKLIIDEANKAITNTAKEAVLKPYGLRDVPVSSQFSKSQTDSFTIASRMFSGTLQTVIHITHSHLTGFMQCTVACSTTIFGVKLS